MSEITRKTSKVPKKDPKETLNEILNFGPEQPSSNELTDRIQELVKRLQEINRRIDDLASRL